MTVHGLDIYDNERTNIIGTGLTYYDGEQLLKPDMVDLSGEPLPCNTFYAVVIKGEPVLAVLAKTIQ